MPLQTRPRKQECDRQTCDSTVDEQNQIEMKEGAVGHEGGRPEVKDDTLSGNTGASTTSQRADNIAEIS